MKEHFLFGGRIEAHEEEWTLLFLDTFPSGGIDKPKFSEMRIDHVPIEIGQRIEVIIREVALKEG